jgi:hypothetical protein
LPVEQVSGEQRRSRLPAQAAGEDFKREPDAVIRLVDLPLGAGGRIDGGDIMLWTIIGILVMLWLLGFLTQVGGGLIHALLVIAVIVFVVNLVMSRRAV